MAIVFPLSLPTSIGIANIELTAINAVAVSRSPFTFAQQVHTYPGQMWSASVSLPPLRREFIEPWVSMLLALRGQAGTFLLGDPNCKAPRGSALGFKKNLLTFTEQFDNAAWLKTASITVTANTTTAPDGNTTADTLDKTSGAFISAFQEVSSTIGTTYTASVYLKQGTATQTQLRLLGSGGIGTLASLIISWSNPSLTGEDVGGGWYRFSLTGVAVDGQVGFFIYPASTGAGTGTVFAWGAQLEEGPLTEYQPIAASYGPFVNGAGQTGGTLIVDGVSPDEDGYLLAGDYIQLGSAITSTLHKVLQDVDTNEAGQATLEIWPGIRTAPADNAPITLTNTVGLFRLSTNQQSWSINESSAYGLSFEAMEVV